MCMPGCVQHNQQLSMRCCTYLYKSSLCNCFYHYCILDLYCACQQEEEERPKKKKKRKAKKEKSGGGGGGGAGGGGGEKSPVDPPIDPDEPTYCLCERVSYGEMIGCDNDSCQIEWFHFDCVGLTHKPKGKWFCPNCRGDKPNIMRPDLLEQLKRSK